MLPSSSQVQGMCHMPGASSWVTSAVVLVTSAPLQCLLQRDVCCTSDSCSHLQPALHMSCCRFSGPTVHFVDEEYDTGPILAQRCVPVYPTDSPKKLAARVLEQVRPRA